MIHGIGYPKFYIFNAAGDTLQSLPPNLEMVSPTDAGSTGIIHLNKGITLTEDEPEWVGRRFEDMPLSRKNMEEFDGYRYNCKIATVQSDYMKGLVAYAAEQASHKVHALYKLRAIQAYSDAGYKIKLSPHHDTEALWQSPFPIWVHPKTQFTKAYRSYSGKALMECIGEEIINDPFSFTAFARTNGLLFNASEYGTFTERNCGAEHTIEFQVTVTDTSIQRAILSSPTSTYNEVVFDGTNLYYRASGVSVNVPHGGLTTAVPYVFSIIRKNADVVFLKNEKLLGVRTISPSGSIFYANRAFVSYDGVNSKHKGYVGHIRIYTTAAPVATMQIQGNYGYGNKPLKLPAYVIWECDGSGGTTTTSESDQSGNGITMTLVNNPPRSAWPDPPYPS